MSYELDLAFTDEQLHTIWLTGTNVIVAKPSGDGAPNVAWQVFRPMAANTLTWEEVYGIYASTSQIQDGAKLTQMTATGLSAVMEKLYTLQADGSISKPGIGGDDNSFALLNQYQSTAGYMTVGLYQSATVNGTEVLKNAVSAAPVMYQSTAVMTPYTNVYIWLASQVVSNSVVTRVTSPMTQVTFGGGVNTASLAYDSTSGKFIPASNNLVQATLTVHEALL